MGILNRRKQRIVNGVLQRLCVCGHCSSYFEVKKNSARKFAPGHHLRGIKPWNFGLTKETDERVLAQAMTQIGSTQSEDHRRNNSESHKGQPAWNKGTGKINQIPQLCECGCGDYAKPGCRFIYKHSHRGTHKTVVTKNQIRVTNLQTWSDEVLLERHSQNAKKVWREIKEKDPNRYPEKPHVEKRIKIVLLPQLCACGCGDYAKPGNKFIFGHYAKIVKGTGKPPTPPQLCACSCGAMTKPGNKYIRGHQLVGKSNWSKGLTKETSPSIEKGAKKQSEVRKGKVTYYPTQETKDLLSKRSTEVWLRPGHREKVHESMSGLNHPFYKQRPGLTPDNWDRDYPMEFDEELKEQIRDRDNHICRLCGKTEQENKTAMDVHHINHDKFDLQWINLISLCKSCHGKTEHSQEYWYKKLSKLLLDDIPLEMKFIDHITIHYRAPQEVAVETFNRMYSM